MNDAKAFGIFITIIIIFGVGVFLGKGFIVDVEIYDEKQRIYKDCLCEKIHNHCNVFDCRVVGCNDYEGHKVTSINRKESWYIVPLESERRHCKDFADAKVSENDN